MTLAAERRWLDGWVAGPRLEGEAYQAARREINLPLVDDPWMQSGEFVVDTEGIVRLACLYNYCADYPDPRVFTTAARLVEPQA